MIQEAIKNALNELDARTYASYADKRQAQGQDSKAAKGRVAAVDAWNRDYGHNSSNYNNNTWNSTYMNNDGDYTVHDDNGSYADTVNGKGGNSMGRQYDPKTNTLNYQHREFDIYGKTIPNKSQGGTIKNGMGSNVGRQVANQMARHLHQRQRLAIIKPPSVRL